MSRVGGAAQVKSMKKVAGTLKIDQAQFSELESFTKFSSDMDKVTAMTLDKGRKNERLLVQPQYSPMSVGEQVAILYCGTRGLMAEIPVERVGDFQTHFLDTMHTSHQDILDALESGSIPEEADAVIRREAHEICQFLCKA